MVTFPQPKNPGSSYSATYDAWNRLVQLTDGVSYYDYYTYDGLARRIVKTTEVSPVLITRHFYYSSAWRVLEERVGSDPTSASAERQYVWGDRYLDELVERDRDTNGDGSLDERLYALQDADFDVTAIADASTGTIVERYSYTPYGTRTIMDGSWGSRTSSSYDWTIGHQGLAHDDLTGLIRDRCRFLHPGLGRFIGRDPLEYVDGMNMYEYVGGNPNGWVDPYGLFVRSMPEQQGAAPDTNTFTSGAAGGVMVLGPYFDDYVHPWLYEHSDWYASAFDTVNDAKNRVDGYLTGLERDYLPDPSSWGNPWDGLKNWWNGKKTTDDKNGKLGDRHYPKDQTKGQVPKTAGDDGNGKKPPDDKKSGGAEDDGGRPQQPSQGGDEVKNALKDGDNAVRDRIDLATRKAWADYFRNVANWGHSSQADLAARFNNARADWLEGNGPWPGRYARDFGH